MSGGSVGRSGKVLESVGRSGKGLRVCWEVGKGVKGLEVRGGFQGLRASSVGIRGLSTVTCKKDILVE